MKRRCLQGVGLVGLSLVTLSVIAKADPLERMAKKLAGGLSEEQNRKVAVLNFPYHDGATSSGSSLVQERLTVWEYGA